MSLQISKRFLYIKLFMINSLFSMHPFPFACYERIELFARINWLKKLLNIWQHLFCYFTIMENLLPYNNLTIHANTPHHSRSMTLWIFWKFENEFFNVSMPKRSNLGIWFDTCMIIDRKAKMSKGLRKWL